MIEVARIQIQEIAGCPEFIHFIFRKVYNFAHDHLFAGLKIYKWYYENEKGK